MTIELVTADNLNPPEAVVCPVLCTSITVVEIDGLASSDFLIRAPWATSPAIRIAAGQKFKLESVVDRLFSPREICFYLETITGTVVFSVVYV